jgi:hypothetical protein
MQSYDGFEIQKNKGQPIVVKDQKIVAGPFTKTACLLIAQNKGRVLIVNLAGDDAQTGHILKEYGCICDYPNGATVAERENASGHYNEAGGFCCPHHGNTCGHCHQYD